MRFCTAGRGASSKRRRRRMTPSPAAIVRKKKPLLVHPTRKNRNRRAGLHPRPTGAGDSPLFRIGGSAVSGVLEGAATSHRRFGADDPFAGASVKLKEHYGIEVPVSTIRALTEKHGEAMWAKQKSGRAWPEHPGVPVLIAEMDGSMVPVVETAAPGAGEAPQDRRKNPPAELERSSPLFGAKPELGDTDLWGDDGERGGSRRALVGMRPGGGSGQPNEDPWSGGCCSLDYRPSGGEVWNARHLSDRFFPPERLPGRGRRSRGGQEQRRLEERKAGRAESESLAGGGGKSPALRGSGQRSGLRGPGSRLLPLSRQPFELPGLPGCSGGRSAHRFGRDRERPSLRDAEPAQDGGGVVEGGKPREDAGPARSSG